MSMTQSRGAVTAAHFQSPAMALLEGMESRGAVEVPRGAFTVFEDFFKTALEAIEGKPDTSSKHIHVLSIASRAATRRRGVTPSLQELKERIEKYREVLSEASAGKYKSIPLDRRESFCDFLSVLIALA